MPGAAALYFPFHLAWLGLYDRVELQAGESVLIHAAAGGSGSAAIQLAKHAGARVFATAGTDAKVQLCRDLGADVAINYNEADFAAGRARTRPANRGVDVVYDNEKLERSCDVTGVPVAVATWDKVARFGNPATSLRRTMGGDPTGWLDELDPVRPVPDSMLEVGARRRRSRRSGREREAAVMRHVREHGYPAPEVFDAGEGWLVMQRLEGRDMLDTIGKTPRGVKQAARQLADLHQRLGAIAAPEWLDAAPGPAGDRMVHLDLHPMNVMSTADGLVVIDWANARRGDPATDVANTWSLLVCGEVPGGPCERVLVALARRLLLRRVPRRDRRGSGAASHAGAGGMAAPRPKPHRRREAPHRQTVLIRSLLREGRLRRDGTRALAGELDVGFAHACAAWENVRLCDCRGRAGQARAMSTRPAHGVEVEGRAESSR